MTTGIVPAGYDTEKAHGGACDGDNRAAANPAALVRAEPAAKLKDALGVDLADAALGHAEHVADLGQRQALVVVEREHESFPLRDAVDRVGEEHLHLVDLERLDRIMETIGCWISDQRLARSLSSGGQDLVEGDEADERDLRERSRELTRAHSQFVGELGVVGRAPQLVLELRVRLLDGTRLGPDRSRDPVEGAELVDDRAFDARDGIGLELETS